MSTGSNPTTLARFGANRTGTRSVEQLLNRKTLRGRPYHLACWQDRPSADDSWELAEIPAPVPEQVAEHLRPS